MSDKRSRGISNLPIQIQDVPDAPTVSATDVGTSRAYNNGAATVTVTKTTGGNPSSFTVTSNPGSISASGTSPVTVTGLSSATSYTFTATATNASGVTSGASSASNSITATTVPQAPTVGTAAATSGSQSATVAVTPNATGGSSITSYTATSSPGGVTGTSATSPVTVTGLNPTTSYTFTVTATNANGTSTASAASNSMTTGVPQFFETVGTVNEDSLYSVAYDSSGNIYIAGYGYNSVNGVYLSKLNSSGVIQWQRLLSVSPQSSYLGYVKVDSSGNVYVAAEFNGATYAYVGVFKYNSSGVLQWQRKLSHTYQVQCNGLEIDASSNLYVVGSKKDTTNAYTVIHLTKYNSSGTFQWSKEYYHGALNNGNTDVARGVGLDSSGNIYTTTSVNYTTTFTALTKWTSAGAYSTETPIRDSTSGGSPYGKVVVDASNVYIIVRGNSNANHILKYNTSLVQQWQRKLTATSSLSLQNICLDSSSNVYVCGFRNNGTWALGYIAKYDSSGVLQWQREIQVSSADCSLTDIVVDSTNIYAVGYSSIATIREGFIAKLPIDGSLTGTYTLGSNTVTYSASSATDAAGTLSTPGGTTNYAAAANITDGAGSVTDTTVTTTTSQAIINP